MNEVYITSLIGGLLIGIAVSILFLFTGKIAGNSGIAAGLLTVFKDKQYWRLFYLAGLILGAAAYQVSSGDIPMTITAPEPMLILGGILVGFGTRLGSGCTSGHGICGCARLSVRSIVATTIFVLTGMITVYVTHIWGVF